jgi:CheY-like chemotaxis protein
MDHHDTGTRNYRGKSILWVGDDRKVVRTVASLNRFVGVHVQTAQTIETAVDILKQFRYDLLVVDYQLCDGTALELMDKLGDLCPNVAIAMSAQAHQTKRSLVSRCFAVGFDAFVEKPFSSMTLDALIRCEPVATSEWAHCVTINPERASLFRSTRIPLYRAGIMAIVSRPDLTLRGHQWSFRRPTPTWLERDGMRLHLYGVEECEVMVPGEVEVEADGQTLKLRSPVRPDSREVDPFCAADIADFAARGYYGISFINAPTTTDCWDLIDQSVMARSLASMFGADTARSTPAAPRASAPPPSPVRIGVAAASEVEAAVPVG